MITEPKWPRKALREAIQGEVRLGFILDKNGIPRDISIIDSLPGTLFNKASLNAL